MSEQENEYFTMLKNNGFDIDGTIERFVGNEALVLKFLRKFPSDNRLDDIVSAWKSHDTENLLLSVHRLKGVAGNLGMKDLFDITNKIVINIRANDLTTIDEDVPELTEIYDRMCRAIAACG